MYAMLETGGLFDDLNAEIKETVDQMTGMIPIKSAGVKVAKDNVLIDAGNPGSSFYVLRDGNLKCEHDDRLIGFWEIGDLLGPEAIFCSQSKFKYHSDFAVTVDEYDAKVFMQKVKSNDDLFSLWNKYVAARSNLLSHITALATKIDTKNQPSLKTFSPGETIIEQDTRANEVYTMLAGKAEVFVDETRVGEVNVDEIFGAMAAFTNSRRTANVVAVDRCEVLVLKKENFMSLIESRPLTVVKMVEDMSNKIVAMNEKLINSNSE